MDDVVTALESQGLDVEQAINEYGPGQVEVAIRYADALRAADNQLKLRDAVRGTVEVKHGLIASFAAKPFADGIGSGAHIHFSLWSQDGTRNLLYDADAERPRPVRDRSRLPGGRPGPPAGARRADLSVAQLLRAAASRRLGGVHGLVGRGQPRVHRPGRLAVPRAGGGVDQPGAQGLRPDLQSVPGARRASSTPASMASGASCSRRSRRARTPRG